MTVMHSPGCVVHELEGEVLLYKPNHHKAIHLNEMAAIIWKLCDGSRSPHQIVECLLAEFPDAPSHTARDIHEAIDALVRHGALIERVAPST